ncbi:MAG: hypothetical protein V4643_05620 [Bacteroidota bacterium]
MSSNIRNTFLFLFIFSVVSLTLQSTIIGLCKESKVFRTLSNQITEEEESHDSDSNDEIFDVIKDSRFLTFHILSKVFWNSTEMKCIAGNKKIPQPPPKSYFM